MNDRFELTSEDCELLLLFEKTGSLEKLSAVVHKDVSVISRRFTDFVSKSPVLEKNRNRWCLTPLGYRVNRWTEEAMLQQRLALNLKPWLRLGATRLFASKVLVSELPYFRRALPELALSISSLDNPVEAALLNGTVDVVFGCGTPNDPAVAFRGKIKERYFAVASKKLKVSSNLNPYELPYLSYRTPSGVYPFSDITTKVKQVVAEFDDPICLIEAVESGLGWTVLPYFAVSKQLDKFNLLPGIELPSKSYGIWWIRDRKSILPAVEIAWDWLKSQEL